MIAWLRGGLVGVLALVALFVGATVESGFWHYGALFLFVLLILALFRLIGRAFDPPGQVRPFVPVPDGQAARLWLCGVFSLAGIVGLFVAASAKEGAAYYLGLMLAAVLWLYVFRLVAASVGGHVEGHAEGRIEGRI